MKETNIASGAGKIKTPPQRLKSLYGKENLYRFICSVERQSGVSDNVIIIVSEAVIDTEEKGKAIEALKVGTDIIYTGKPQTMRNTETDQIDVFVLADYVRTGYAAPQNDIRIISGTVARPVKHRLTPKGKPITDIMVKIPSVFAENFMCNIPVVAWYKEATAAAELKEGDIIRIEGRLQSRQYVKNFDGFEEWKETTEISANKITKL